MAYYTITTSGNLPVYTEAPTAQDAKKKIEALFGPLPSKSTGHEVTAAEIVDVELII